MHLQCKEVGGIMVLPNVGTTGHEVQSTVCQVKVKVHFSPLLVTKAYKGSGGIATPIVNLDIEWS